MLSFDQPEKYGISAITSGGLPEPVSDWPEKRAEAYKADFGCEQ